MARVFVTGSADGFRQLATRRIVDGGHRDVLHARSRRRAKQALIAAPGAGTAMLRDFSIIAERRKIAEAESQDL